MVSANYIGNATRHLWSTQPINPVLYVPGVGNANGNCTLNGQVFGSGFAAVVTYDQLGEGDLIVCEFFNLPLEDDSDTGRLQIKRWRRDANGVDASDPRTITVDGSTWLTSISHLRLARSTDGAAALRPSPKNATPSKRR